PALTCTDQPSASSCSRYPATTSSATGKSGYWPSICSSCHLGDDWVHLTPGRAAGDALGRAVLMPAPSERLMGGAVRVPAEHQLPDGGKLFYTDEPPLRPNYTSEGKDRQRRRDSPGQDGGMVSSPWRATI